MHNGYNRLILFTHKPVLLFTHYKREIMSFNDGGSGARAGEESEICRDGSFEMNGEEGSYFWGPV